MLNGKHILLGISGGIAAYKCASLARLLVKAGAEVRVLMTPMARHFVTPLTMATVSQHPIVVDFFNPENGEWNSHVSLGLWADAFVIAPATANTLGKMANGIADNLLLTSYLSAKCPVFAAPAMDLDMMAHPAVLRNISTLRSFGVNIIEASSGFLASGLQGKGRMAEPEAIVGTLSDFFSGNPGKQNNPNCPNNQEEQVNQVNQVNNHNCQGGQGSQEGQITNFANGGCDGCGSSPSPSPSSSPSHPQDLLGKKVLVTAGPTFEKIDPVRFIGNYSSGKMGFALAEECAARGAEVWLVAGPTSLKTDHQGIHRVDVEAALEMMEASQNLWPSCNIGILCAAVADYRPASMAQLKIKRHDGEALSLNLVPNPDIAAALGSLKQPGQLLVGFALETDSEDQNARGKCLKKNFDFIVLNSLRDQNAGFRYDTNKVTIINRDGSSLPFPLKPKTEVAADIVNHAVSLL